MNFKTQYTNHPKHLEKNHGPHMTVPDQTMTIQEMLVKHAQGLSFSGQKVPIYEDNDPLGGVDPRTMDLTELADLRDQALARVAEERKNARKRYDDSLAAKRQAEIDKAVAERLKQQQGGEQPPSSTNNP